LAIAFLRATPHFRAKSAKSQKKKLLARQELFFMFGWGG